MGLAFVLMRPSQRGCPSLGRVSQRDGSRQFAAEHDLTKTNEESHDEKWRFNRRDRLRILDLNCFGGRVAR